MNLLHATFSITVVCCLALTVVFAILKVLDYACGAEFPIKWKALIIAFIVLLGVAFLLDRLNLLWPM